MFRKPVNNKHPLNPQFVKMGSKRFYRLYEQGRQEHPLVFDGLQGAAVWRQRNPNITDYDLCLLLCLGELGFRVTDLDLYLVIHIADFLYPNKPHRCEPSEWLILSALYRQFIPKDVHGFALSGDDIPPYLRDAIDVAVPRDRGNFAKMDNSSAVSFKNCLLEAAIRESEYAVIITATHIANCLTQSDHEHQLSLVSILGTRAQKARTLYALLEALQGQYSLCAVHYVYADSKRRQQHAIAYAQTKKHAQFIIQHYDVYVQRLKKASPAPGSLEAKIVNEYPKFLSGAQTTLRDCPLQLKKTSPFAWKLRK